MAARDKVRRRIPGWAMLPLRGSKDLVYELRARRRTKARLRELVSSPLPVGSRRLEFGSGPYPTQGFIHVDLDPRATNLDLKYAADAVPLPDNWADEILAVHVIEHLAPDAVEKTLRSWHRLLTPGGRLEIHVPNGSALCEAVVRSDERQDLAPLWRAIAGIFGYNMDPKAATGLGALRGETEHRLLYTALSLHHQLSAAGFTEISRSGEHNCRHVGPWEDYVPGFCLRMLATKDGR